MKATFLLCQKTKKPVQKESKQAAHPMNDVQCVHTKNLIKTLHNWWLWNIWNYYSAIYQFLKHTSFFQFLGYCCLLYVASSSARCIHSMWACPATLTSRPIPSLLIRSINVRSVICKNAKRAVITSVTDRSRCITDTSRRIVQNAGGHHTGTFRKHICRARCTGSHLLTGRSQWTKDTHSSHPSSHSCTGTLPRHTDHVLTQKKKRKP